MFFAAARKSSPLALFQKTNLTVPTAVPELNRTVSFAIKIFLLALLLGFKRSNKLHSIILRDKKEWQREYLALHAADVKVPRATNAGDAILFVSETVGDFRRATRILDGLRVEYHNFSLNADCDKVGRAVIRGIPNEFIDEELRSLGYPVVSARSILKGTNRVSTDFVRVDAAG